MAQLTDKQKKYAMVGAAGLILLYLLYRWYQNNAAANAASTTGSTTAPDTSGADYASLAGQEQGDVAALQSQEQSDVAGLQSGLGTLTGQEQSDVSGLTGMIVGLSSQLQNLASIQPSGTEVASAAMGATPVSSASISTHKGGPFYNYYVKVTGHAPPATVQVSNFIYQAWKSGVNATSLQATPTSHPSAPNQTQVAHPNPTHSQQSYLAPGVKAPSYTLVPPKGAPSTARWGGTNAPAGWRGIGGGWYVPK